MTIELSLVVKKTLVTLSVLLIGIFLLLRFVMNIRTVLMAKMSPAIAHTLALTFDVWRINFVKKAPMV